MYGGLVQELESYAAVAEEGGKIYCAALMKQAAQALRKEKGPMPEAAGHEAGA